ncbi:MAG TPA: N-acetylmuramoyl-L-alanine amidase [Epulopiscium sp.]|nr:N-acetylmuramoyl-L-alanine amidase [Candidatus Epulonipiscium sp.]
MAKICFDYGHGGKDPGAVGNGLKEKVIVLSAGAKATKILQQHNVEVIHTRVVDTFIELSERARIANKAKVDILVSLHCNAFTNPDAQGVEVFHYPNSSKGKELSQSILDSIVKDKLYTKNRGIKTNDFAVLRLTEMPSCLVELGFISNQEDAAILKNKQDELAVAVAKGILAHLGIVYNEATKKPSTLDDQYKKAVTELMNHNIIRSPAAWLNVNKITVNNLKSLIIKFAKKIDGNVKDYDSAVDVLVSVRIISNTQAWNEKNINVKNAVPLIIKMSAYMARGI